MRQAVILVGGRGTRLGELAKDIPKPLLSVAGDVRFLDVMIDDLSRFGLRDIILLAGHLGEQVVARYEGALIRGAAVSVIRESEPAGTAGALRYAADRLDDVFFLANGDGLFDFNILALRQALRPDDIGALAIRQVPDGRRYGLVELDGRHISAFREKDESRTGAAFISAGVYCLRREVLDRISTTPCSIEADVFPRLASERRLAFVEGKGYFIDIGLPETLAMARTTLLDVVRRPAVFFDRDGTLTRDLGYSYRVEDLVWLPGAIEAIRACNDAGWLAIVVTNQSGLARGFYEEADMHRFHAAMQSALAEHGAHLDAFYHSPYHEHGSVARWTVKNHPDRKPNSGLFRRAQLEWPIDRSRSIMVGDRETDVEAACAAGIRGVRLVEGNLEHIVRAALTTPRSSTRECGAAVAHRQLQTRAAMAHDWLTRIALPHWWIHGFDRDAGLFHEKLYLNGTPVAGLPRRTRVQARQTFVYATAMRVDPAGPWAEATRAGVSALLTRSIHSRGGTVFLLDPQGEALDTRRDLYDLAFVVFALAHAAAALSEKDELIGAATELIHWLETNWTHPNGGFREGEIMPSPPRRQNPHMHLFEALLALYAATGDAAFLVRANRIATLLATRLFNPDAGALPEYFDDAWHPALGEEGEIVEPGHLFEWSWLLHQLALAGGDDHRSIAERLRVHAEAYGVDPATGVTLDEVYLNGLPRIRTSRLWPQTERMKANLARYEQTRDPDAAAAVSSAFDMLQTYLQTPAPGLWRDRRLPDGAFVDEPAPASSFYHIVLAYAELKRVAALC